MKNVGYTDAFMDFVVEPNAVGGTFNGSYMMRSAFDLGAVWTGEVLMVFRYRLLVHRSTEYSWNSTAELYDANGALVLERKFGKYVTGGHNWLSDTELNLRWRVDRDRATRLDTFASTYQGDNQGTDLLRAAGRHITMTPIGFIPLARR